MIVTFVSLKGGVGKTTSAIHLACYLAQKGKTLLLDNDPSKYAIGYDANGPGLPCTVAPMSQAAAKVPKFDHVVIDTQARPSEQDILDYAEGCDFMVLPTTPSAMPLEGLVQLTTKLQQVPEAKWRVLLTIVPPKPSIQGVETREVLREAQIPQFGSWIPRAAVFDHASKAGVPIYDFDGRGREVWRAYEELGEEIYGHQ